MSRAGRAPITTLAYHDVISAGEPDASGFPGPDAARYKLDQVSFGQHLEAMAAAVASPPVTGHDILDGSVPAAGSWSLTFDDGGSSAVTIAADLESRGWRGQFFITTDRIGEPGFVDDEAIRRLDRAGHVVGSHSHTHPQRMAACSADQLVQEWRASVERLEAVLGSPPAVGAIPGGWYSAEVARAAAACGIRLLYTSEPVRRVSSVDGCLVAGRFALLDRSGARTAASLAAGKPLPRIQQRARRLALQPAKRLSGDGYLRVRGALLRLRDR